MSVLIFANGDLDSVSWIRPYLAEATAVIAANGGTRHLWRLRHAPERVIGDLDSLPRDVQTWLAGKSVHVERSPAAKDETDLELALLYAASHYTDEIVVIGAFGGRLDQTLANVLLLAHPQMAGRRVTLMTAYERAWLVEDATEIHGAVGDAVSLIPLDGDVHVHATRGLRWPLRAETLRFGESRGISNAMTDPTAAVAITSGRLLCIHTYRAWGR